MSIKLIIKTNTGGLALTVGLVSAHDAFLCSLLKRHSPEHEYGQYFDFMHKYELCLCLYRYPKLPNEREVAPYYFQLG